MSRNAERFLRMLDEIWHEGYAEGYASPDMPADYTPLSPYSPDRTEEDA